MSSFPCYLGQASWGGKNPGRFYPSGSIFKSERATELGSIGAVGWSAKTTYSARFFVGFSVGNKPKWDLDDLIKVVKRVRMEQQPKDPAATFLAQRGVYKYEETGKVIEENGGQAIIINTKDTLKVFQKQMLELAEILVKELKQKMVILEIQKQGIVQTTYGIVPD